MPSSKLDQLFEKLCREDPEDKHFDGFRKYPDRDATIVFLINRLRKYIRHLDGEIEVEDSFEYGVAHGCQLLGEFKASQAVPILIEVLDRVKEDDIDMCLVAVADALRELGEVALESVYQKYLEDMEDPDWAWAWLSVLAQMGVKDERVSWALSRHWLVINSEVVNHMIGYRDAAFEPQVQVYVEKAAEYLNHYRLDPYTLPTMLDDSVAYNYVTASGGLVTLREGVAPPDPRFLEARDVLDRQLLKHSAFSRTPSEADIETYVKLRMDSLLEKPCACGSGKMLRECCGESLDQFPASLRDES